MADDKNAIQRVSSRLWGRFASLMMIKGFPLTPVRGYHNGHLLSGVSLARVEIEFYGRQFVRGSN